MSGPVPEILRTESKEAHSEEVMAEWGRRMLSREIAGEYV